MEQTISISLPLPPKECSPNSRCHWAVKSRAAKSAKEIAFYGAKKAGVTGKTHSWDKAFMQPIFTFTVNRKRDLDNLLASMKNQIDGVVAAGLMVNDCGISPLPSKIIIGKKPGVVLEFTKME